MDRLILLTTFSENSTPMKKKNKMLEHVFKHGNLSGETTSANVLLDDILKDAPNVDFEMVKRSVVTAENIENAFSKNAKQILYARRRRKNDGIKTYHIFVPSTLKLFEQALLQFSTVMYPEATPVQTVEQTIRKDVGREDAGATGQIPTELQATVGLESPTTLPGEANAIGADVIETGQTMKMENQELRKEIVAVKKERDLLKSS